MKPRIFVRNLFEEEQKSLSAGLRSSDAFVLRRSQILLASARGDAVPRIAQVLSCDEQTVRHAIYAFNQQGLIALQAGSSRPHHLPTVLREDVTAEMFKTVLHRPPRDFGFETSLWTLNLLVKQCVRLGWMARAVSIETMRQTLNRLEINWKRAKHWVTSPDPLYQKKKRSRSIADLGLAREAGGHLGDRLSR
jgi:transposase